MPHTNDNNRYMYGEALFETSETGLHENKAKQIKPKISGTNSPKFNLQPKNQ